MQKNATAKLFNARIDYDAELNPEQLAVVKNGDGPCVVLAGAGSGKTRTIVYRVAWLLEHGIAPDRVLLLTFTNKAAGEMMTRIGELLGTAMPFGSGGVWGGTFHSIANRILRSFADRIGFTASFSILDDEDSRDLMKATMRELGFTPDGKRFPSPAVVRDLLSYKVNAMKSLEEAVAKKHPKFEPFIPDLRKIADAYDEKKRRSNAMDFDDLLVRLHRLLAEDAGARERVAGRWSHVLVDEYQDTNPLQASLVNYMTGPSKNLLVVGDDAQSIYSFRAADVRNILDFPKHHPDARIFKLETNYRSTPEILHLANDVISRNLDQFPKEL
ncbi:MAG TPA: ATP-dependent helicase, partial [Candidatus Eisenbacteria bacterium]|nr:ATP-dependent helicase [Candidatus Eisenbacteria bacterium]